jgi:hypothetical protein
VNQPSAQGAFACIGHYLPQWLLSRTIGGHCPAFLAPTRPCVRPKPSSRLRLRLIQDVFAGCCRPLLGIGPSRHYLRESFTTCQVPYPGGSPWCLCPFLPTATSAFPQSTNGRPSHIYPYSNFRMGGDFGVADIPSCSGLLLCWPPWLLLPTIHTVSSCDFYIQAHPSRLPWPGFGYASRPNRAIDGTRTLTSPDSRPCRLLRGLSPPTPCRFLPALSQRPQNYYLT